MSEDFYFSEREKGSLPRDRREINQGFWNGFIVLFRRCVNEGYLTEKFPEKCGLYPYACYTHAIYLALDAEIPSVEWHLKEDRVPQTLEVVDLVEFFYRYVSKPTRKERHESFEHEHILAFDKVAGRQEYLSDVNRLFRRNRLVYELQANGQVQYIAPIVLREALISTTFRTEDPELNRLLELAREKFRDPALEMRREAVEKLWDAWERLKVIEEAPNKDKKQRIIALLTKAVPQEKFRDHIEKEAAALNVIGNEFAIRHSEKEVLNESDYLDYLFFRLFALIQLLLRRTKRGE